jgi:hypothetical protein
MRRVLIISLLILVAILFSAFLSSNINSEQGNRACCEEEKHPGSTSMASQKKTDSSRNTNHSITNDKFASYLKKLTRAMNVSSEKNLPKSIDEVEITPGLKKFLDSWPGGYEKIDYRLKLFDKLSICLENKEPSSGKLTINLMFDIDKEEKIAIASDGNGSTNPEIAFRVKASTLSEEDQEMVMACIYDAHMSLTMDVRLMWAS